MSNRPKPEDYQYKGEAQPPQDGERDSQGRLYYPYLPDENLKEAVNLAIDLERPLLLEGEPGCGKTRLAGAIAYEFTKGKIDEEGKWWPYYIWNVKSTSRARDGLYTYDAVARLRDAQLVGAERLQDYLDETELQDLAERLRNRTKYRELGALGEALQHTDCRPILLIDEIDKADTDFPNDLLLELEERRFEIPETGEQIPPPGQQPKTPIIVITSNCSKPLPEPFLRRCLYFFVEFPDEDLLLQIVDKRFTLTKKQDELVAKAVDRFFEIRDLLKERPGSRPPGTSEFLEFLTALLRKSKQSLPQARKDLENLANRQPLLGTLLKTQIDQKLYRDTFSPEDE